MWIYFVYNTLVYLAVTISRSRAIAIIIFISYIIFVGFRYETGTDWQVYKPNYQIIAETYELSDFWSASLQYGQEPGFIFLNSVFAKIFSEFEYLQCFISIFFISSFYQLSKTFGAKNIPMALAISSPYLWMNLEFSVLRQSLSIACFNFGVSCFVRRRSTLGVILFAFAILCHFSSAIYIGSFFVAKFPMRKSRMLFLFLSIAALGISMTAGNIFPGFAPDLASSKIDFYASRATFRFLDVDNIWIFSFFIFGIVVVLRNRQIGVHPSESNVLLGNMILGLGVIGMAAAIVPVFRDRVSYEFIILLAVYVTLPSFNWLKASKSLILMWGFVFSIYKVAFTVMIPYAPYQNYLVYSFLEMESSGETRMRQFLSYQYYSR